MVFKGELFKNASSIHIFVYLSPCTNAESGISWLRPERRKTATQK